MANVGEVKSRVDYDVLEGFEERWDKFAPQHCAVLITVRQSHLDLPCSELGLVIGQITLFHVGLRRKNQVVLLLLRIYRLHYFFLTLCLQVDAWNFTQKIDGNLLAYIDTHSV